MKLATNRGGLIRKNMIPAMVNISIEAIFKMVSISLTFPASLTPTIFITVKNSTKSILIII